MKKYHGILLLLPLMIGGCNNSKPYKEETIKVRYVDSKNDTTCTLRYYDESVMPYI